MSEPFVVYWAAVAERDLLGIIDYIAEERPEAARELLQTIQTLAARLARSPERGRLVPELRAQGVARYRELLSAPWRIIYRVDGRRVYVLAVVDGRRNLEDLLLARLIK